MECISVNHIDAINSLKDLVNANKTRDLRELWRATGLLICNKWLYLLDYLNSKPGNDMYEGADIIKQELLESLDLTEAQLDIMLPIFDQSWLISMLIYWKNHYNRDILNGNKHYWSIKRSRNEDIANIIIMFEGVFPVLDQSKETRIGGYIILRRTVSISPSALVFKDWYNRIIVTDLGSKIFASESAANRVYNSNEIIVIDL